jgi:hypothetical protein
MSQPMRGPDNSMAHLPSSLASQGSDLRRRTRRVNRLYKEQQRLRRQKQQLRRDVANLEGAKKHFEDGYNYILQHVVLPFAKKRNLEFNDKTYSTMDLVLHPLLKDATQARTLCGRLQVLQGQVQAQREEINGSQDEAKASHGLFKVSQEQIEALHNEVMALRGKAETAQKEVTVSQSQLLSSRNQIQGLQKQLLAGVDKVNVYIDDQLSQDFRALIALVKSLSRSVRIAQNVDVPGTLKPCGMIKGVANRHWDSRVRIKSYIEAWVWSTLLTMVFASPFRIFGEFGKMLDENWAMVFETEEQSLLPHPSVLSEKWRYTTMEQLVRMVGRDTITSGHIEGVPSHSASANSKEWVKEILKTRSEVAQTLGTKLLSVSSRVDVSGISHIIDKAFSLVYQMSLQHSRIQVTFPEPGAEFSNVDMESLPDADGEDMTEGKVAFIINPGLTKWGDANGRMLDQYNVIVLPLVQLESSSIKRESEWM